MMVIFFTWSKIKGQNDKNNNCNNQLLTVNLFRMKFLIELGKGKANFVILETFLRKANCLSSVKRLALLIMQTSRLSCRCNT